jgi:methylated-DNA-[protein]-cysteine S-methyltransferase
MKTLHDELIAMLLGEAPPSARLERWLGTAAGRRARAAFARTLAALRRWGDLATPPRLRPVAYYDALSTPIGRVHVAVTDAGLVRIAFRRSDAAFLAEMRARLGVDGLRSPERTAAVARQLEAYFAGRRRAFDLPVDLHRLTPFQRRVLAAAAGVPAGHVVSYGEIARRVGRPRGSRAVGQALGRNPVPIVIPCHRVVAAGGGLGGYTGGLAIKRTLLRLEGARAAAG